MKAAAMQHRVYSSDSLLAPGTGACAASRKGTSLLEVMIAMIVLALAGFALLGSFASSTTSNHISEQESRAMDGITTMINKVRSTTFSYIYPSSTGSYFANTSSTYSFDVSGLAPPTGVSHVGSMAWDANSTSSLYGVLITVQFQGDSESKTVGTYVYYIANVPRL
jgi:type II secretory pathway pseudopilin PulG